MKKLFLLSMAALLTTGAVMACEGKKCDKKDCCKKEAKAEDKKSCCKKASSTKA
ncbi:hypothetical protein KJS94_15915 [Flavihumibacter rivuli]|uniref:hypothetical protein n=1 Tax=Flavihumibacter rivuli TaxID=2838156 RepID=UPI001BDE39D0|nr:hypothetical protein [Flavihumibacter rivuli]ULQ56135.1 hypothetical protein KJS94_15915 [Flavihumibacter rivuli]